MQMVEYEETNLTYMCMTCKEIHLARPDSGLNICVGGNQIHNLHTPRASNSPSLAPDPVHIDWLSVCDATIAEMEHAWLCDYKNQPRPMRVLVTAGLVDLARGKTRDEIVEMFMHFKETVEKQNRFHPQVKNEFVIATILNPPRFTWFADNGPPPRNHQNLLSEIKELNSWIVFYNNQNGKSMTPRFHRFGVKDCWALGQEKKRKRVKRHIFSQWCQDKPVKDRMYLNEVMKVRLGVAIVRHFQGEKERNGVLI